MFNYFLLIRGLMSLSEKMSEDLWFQLRLSIKDSEKFRELAKKCEDPVSAAKIRVDELAGEIIEKYGKENGEEILNSVSLASMMNGFIGMMNGELTLVERGVPKTPYKMSIPHWTGSEASLTIDQGMAISTYLREKHGVKPEDLPLLYELGNCWRIYRGTLNELIKQMEKELNNMYRSGLSEALGIIDSINPTPGYPTRLLTYEIMNHKLYKKAKESEDHDGSWLDRFDKEEMGVLASIAETFEQKGFIDPDSFPSSYRYLFKRFYELGLLKLATRSGQPVYHIDEDGLYNSTLVVRNRTHLSHGDIRSLNDLKKLKD
jgi:hypothetical protein